MGNRLTFVVVTGMSGAGKTQALRSLEDLGYFCIDNLPPALLPKVVELCERTEGQGKIDRVAVGSDVRGGEFFDELEEALQGMQEEGVSHQILFLEADDETLVKRYKETRRRHPLSEGTVLGAIQAERRRLAQLRLRSSIVVDTSHLSPHRLRQELQQLFGKDHTGGDFFITIVTFGFKHGLPLDADLVFDVRFLANPFYVRDLRPLSGQAPEVQEYVFASGVARSFMQRLDKLLNFLIPHYVVEGKSQLTVAIGCTGGRHRSLAVAERLTERMRKQGHTVLLDHRDMDRGTE